MGKIEKIKLRDFKSFRNAVIPFVDGFIAIVGPNGSGKSNILDAILFVMGEGSMKTLRAVRVKDLVHHSSKTGTAEVTVQIRKGKERYNITREIDRQGVSVYRINGKRTTRSEVQELLNTLGIPTEGYNMILQGDVTNFIKMSPNQRREIIEEIAGISEYEAKKDKALSELEKVEEKIKEANILLHERKGYLGELKKERDEALRYKKYKQELLVVRSNLVKRELDRVRKIFDQKLELLENLKLEMQEMNNEMEKLEGEIRNLQSQLDEVNESIVQRGEKEHLEIGKKIEGTRTEIKYLQEKYVSLSKRLETNNSELSTIVNKISELEKELAKKKKSLHKLEAQLADYRRRIKKKEEKLGKYRKEMEDHDLLVTDIVKRLDNYTSEIKKKQESYYSLLSEINLLKEKLSVLKLTVSRISREISSSGEKMELERELQELRKQLATYKAEILKKENELQDMFEKEKQLNSRYHELDEQLEKFKERYHSLRSRITTIRAITGNEASDAVIRASERGELDGILGRVSDLFDYPDEYAIAIQTAAGPRLNFIVTRDDASATQAVKWLKRKKIGRTSFIPLNKIRSNNLRHDLLDNRGVIGYLIDLIHFEPSLKPVFDYVFGDTLLVKDIDTARNIGFGKVRMVTLDGDLIEASGVVTGGYNQAVMTLKELKEKDELKKRIENLEKEKDRIVSKIEQIRKMQEEKRKEKSQLEVMAREKEARIKVIESKISEYLAVKSKQESEIKKARDEIEKINAQIKEKEEMAKKIKSKIDELENERTNLKEKLEKPEVKEAAKKLDEMQRELEKIKAEATDVEIRYNSLKSEIELLGESRYNELLKRKSELEQEKKETITEMENIKNKIFDLENALNSMLEEEEKISRMIGDLISKREELQRRINEKAEKRGSLLRLIENKRREISEVEIEKTKLETRLLDLQNEWENLKDNFREVKKSDQELKEEMDKIKKRLDNIGPINMKAIEMYEKALKDLQNIEEKMNKLLDEKKAVIELINQIEKRKKEVFMKTLEGIRQNFKRIYKEFTQDPNAYSDIRLENEEDPFSSGLIVEARPSGKPVKRIESLSGGEQAVVALTFLFAIQDYKPSPFYALDEVDAPLDRANSERFAKLIKERAKISQFIVVTHNAVLIHDADQIVGVSMNKKLGSSVVEIDMRDYISKTDS